MVMWFHGCRFHPLLVNQSAFHCTMNDVHTFEGVHYIPIKVTRDKETNGFLLVDSRSRCPNLVINRNGALSYGWLGQSSWRLHATGPCHQLHPSGEASGSKETFLRAFFFLLASHADAASQGPQPSAAEGTQYSRTTQVLGLSPHFLPFSPFPPHFPTFFWFPVFLHEPQGEP